MGQMMRCRCFAPFVVAAASAIILPVIREGATYALDADMSEADALASWMGRDKETFVAEEDGAIVGSYYSQWGVIAILPRWCLVAARSASGAFSRANV